MTDVVRPAPPAAALSDGDASQQQDPQVDADVQEKLAQMKSELERLLELQRGWTELQQRKLEQKLELEEILGAHAAPKEARQDLSAHDEQQSQQALGVSVQLGENAEQTWIAVRNEDLRQLQDQMDAVTKQKQQQAASELTEKLEELNTIAAVADASAADGVAVTSMTLLAKRKLDDAVPSGARAAKRLATRLPVSTKLHEFSSAPASLTTSPEWKRAALFRIAVRYYLQTYQRISTELLADKFKGYTGRAIQFSEMEDFLLVLLVLPSLQQDTASSRRMRGCDGVTFHGHRRSWCPGSQSLTAPTFCASEHDDLVAMIELEKEVVEQVCTSVLRDPTADLSQAQRIQDAACQATFFTNLTSVFTRSDRSSSGNTPSSIYHALSDMMGNHSAPESTQCRYVRHHRFRQFAGFLIGAEEWLVAINSGGEGENDESMGLGALESVHSRKTLASSATVKITATARSTASRKPFDLDQDSVFQQVRSIRPATAAGSSKPRKMKKLDPMNMICMYELSGVCNDENCPYQHQRDFEPSDDEDEESEENNDSEPRLADGCQSPQLVSKEQTRLLQDFAHLRSKVMRKWPAITGQGAAVVDAPRSKKPAIETNSSAPSGGNSTTAITSLNGEADDDSFLQLEDESEAMQLGMNKTTISGNGGSRYCETDESMSFSVQALEENIARDPGDTDSWLLLAIHQLDFEVKQSDDTTRTSDSTRLLGQLTSIVRCVHMSAFSASPTPDETKLKLSLHTLSRAIEIEANAYCEALWLLYLHLSSLLPKRDDDLEFEMAEQAMQLIPSSHRLWVHYIAVGKLNSIQLSEALHSRVLCHVSKPGSFESPDDKKTPNLSALLTALVIHLCIKLRAAGSTWRAVELLTTLLLRGVSTQDKDNNEPKADSGFGWCAIVRSQLSWSDVAILAMVYAHLLLFDEIPTHICKWLRVSGDQQQVQIAAFAFTVETFESEQARLRNLPARDLRSAIDAYECAINSVDESGEGDSEASRLFMSVLQPNWMILIVSPPGANRSIIDSLLCQRRDFVLSLPDAALTAAKILASGPMPQPRRARELLVNMLKQSTAKTLPKALHYYLSAPRSFMVSTPEIESLLELDVVLRLAQELVSSAAREELIKSIAEIKNEMNPFTKGKALKKMLYGLLSAWMDQLAVASCHTDSSSPLTVDIYTALAICQLMGKLLEPSVAIDGLELVLNSSKLRFLSTDSRQLAWTLRFAFQLDVMTRDFSQPQANKKLDRASLLQLLRRYMEAMNVVSESLLQASRRISSAVEQEGIQSAIFECLYPHHSPWLLLDDNMAMFELCAAAAPAFELSSHYGAYSYWLTPSPRFCVGYAEVAAHHWEWRKIRQGLRKCLLDSSSHDTALRALVVLELKNQNIKGVAQILEDELSTDPLSMESWRLVLGMEILFGESSDSSSASERANELVTELAKRTLAVQSNLYNDMELLLSSSKSSLREASQILVASQATGNFCGWGFHRVPNTLFTMKNLQTLDMSGNFLVEIPEAISRLTQLQVLNISQNALVILPPALSKLSELRELNASHNNLSAIPGILWVHLLKLQELNLSENAISHLPAPPLSHLQELRVLQVSNNLLSSENVAQIRRLMSTKCVINGEMDSNGAGESRSVNLVESADEEETVSREQHVSPESTTRLLTVDLVTGVGDDEDSHEIVAEQRPAKPQPSSEDEDDVSMLEDGEIDDTEDTETQNDAQQPQNASPEGPSSTISPEVEDQVDSAPPNSNDGNSNDIEMTDEQQLSLPEEEPSRDTVVDLSVENHTEDDLAGSTAVTATITNGELTIYKAGELSDKLETNINEKHVSRPQLKRQNPALWRKYVESQVQLHAGLGNCAMCNLPNEGWNQRLNTMVLCPSCLRCAVEMLQERAMTESESKEEC